MPNRRSLVDAPRVQLSLTGKVSGGMDGAFGEALEEKKTILSARN
jgi:hypothetical protein